jgi:hypothetical protein
MIEYFVTVMYEESLCRIFTMFGGDLVAGGLPKARGTVCCSCIVSQHVSYFHTFVPRKRKQCLSRADDSTLYHPQCFGRGELFSKLKLVKPNEQ